MKTKTQITRFINDVLSELLKMDADHILPDVPLDSHYGLESMDFMSLCGRLEDWLDIELDAQEIFQCKTIENLADNLARINEAG